MSSKVSTLIVLAAASIALTFGVAGCSKTEIQNNGAQSQPAQADQTQDPAATANLAPTDGTQATGANVQQQNNQQAAPAVQQASQDQNYSNTDYNAGSQDASYGQPVLQARQPPPPLPEYSQPPSPGYGYLWTPGYWSYAPQGYYWVPGAWRGRLKWASCGRPDIGDSLAACINTITAFGANMSATTAALTMDSATSAPAIRAGIGAEIGSTITVPSTT